MNHQNPSFFAMLVMGVSSSLFAGTVTYTQPTDAGSPYASQNDTSGLGNFATAYDNFTLASTGDVTDISWVGSYFDPPTPVAPAQFTLQILTDNGGQPGTVLTSFTVAGNAGETSLGTDGSGDPYFSYTTGAGDYFTATGGTTYWLSIVPDLPFLPQWGWETGTGGDGVAYQVFFGSGAQVPNDLAFSLTESFSPEPQFFPLIAAGLSIMIVLARRRRTV